MPEILENQEKSAARLLFGGDEALGTVLCALMLHYYGPEFYNWEAETIKIQVEEDFGTISDVNVDKIAAISAAVVTGEFYRTPLVFLQTVEVLNGSPADWETFDPTSVLPAEIAWAVLEMRLNDSEPPVYSPDISRVVGLILSQNGFVTPPKSLSWAAIDRGYLGSTSGEEIDRSERASGRAEEVLEDYIREQAHDLFQQIASLPWITEKDIGKLVQIVNDEAGVNLPKVAEFAYFPVRT